MLPRSELGAFCCADRDQLLEMYCRQKRITLTDAPVPAEILDDILEDMLGMRVVPKVLGANVLGQCDFDLREIWFNTRMRQFSYPNTKIEGLVEQHQGPRTGTHPSRSRARAAGRV